SSGPSGRDSECSVVTRWSSGTDGEGFAAGADGSAAAPAAVSAGRGCSVTRAPSGRWRRPRCYAGPRPAPGVQSSAAMSWDSSAPSSLSRTTIRIGSTFVHTMNRRPTTSIATPAQRSALRPSVFAAARSSKANRPMPIRIRPNSPSSVPMKLRMSKAPAVCTDASSGGSAAGVRPWLALCALCALMSFLLRPRSGEDDVQDDDQAQTEPGHGDGAVPQRQVLLVGVDQVRLRGLRVDQTLQRMGGLRGGEPSDHDRDDDVDHERGGGADEREALAGQLEQAAEGRGGP